MRAKKIDTILHVEDEPDLRYLCETALTEIGKYQVQSSSNGEEALKVLDEWTPDLIILDVQMPIMDGITTYHHIRKNKNLFFTPIIFLTGISCSLEMSELLSIGALACISKPFEPIKLCDEIDQIWSERNR